MVTRGILPAFCDHLWISSDFTSGYCNLTRWALGDISKMLMSLQISDLLNFHFSINYTSFNVWVRYFVWNFKGYPLKFYTKYLTHTWKTAVYFTLFKIYKLSDLRAHIDGLVQDCSNSSALAMELLQSCTKPSICVSKISPWWFI